VSWDDFERAQRMIDGNRLSDHTVGPARRGRGLLASVLRCRRCARMLRVYYKGPEGAIVRYACPQAQLDNTEARCIAFNGGLIDAAVARELLRVVEPAAIEATVLASQQQVQAQAEVVQALRRDLQAAQYRAQRAERQYEATDPQNRLVAEELERRWNVALQEVRSLEARIAADSKIEESTSAASLEEFKNLASDLEAVWNDANGNHSAKKRILRALICEIVVDIDEQASELVLVIHWKGGVHTPLRLPRRRKGESTRHTSKDIVEAVRALTRIYNDQMIAGVLNRAKLLTGHGNYWTRALVTALRHNHKIDRHDPARQAAEGWMNLSNAAKLVGLSHAKLRVAIDRGDIVAERPIACGPFVLNKRALETEAAARFLRTQLGQVDPTSAVASHRSLDLSTT
jgi:hypothetical protein